MAYGNGTFIGVGDGFDFISHNGSNWTVSETTPVVTNGGVAFGDGMFLAFGTNSQYKANYILQSTNETTWTPIYTSANTLFAAAYGNDMWVFIGSNNDIVTATIGPSNWTWTEFQATFSPLCICYANGNFVIGGYVNGPAANGTGSIFSSQDGMNWEYDASDVGCSSIAYGNGVYVAASGQDASSVFVSSNLLQWTTVGLSAYANSSMPVTYGGNFFAFCPTEYESNGIAYSGIQTSANGYTWKTNFVCAWTTNSVGETRGFPILTTLEYGQGTFVGYSGGVNSIYQSGVFATVSNPPPAALAISTYPGVTIKGTPGLTYQVQYTTNLNSTWLPLATFVLPYTPYIWVDTSSPVVGQRFYQAVQTQ